MNTKEKAPTEPFNLGDAWDGFKATYLPFVEWMRDSSDSFDFIQITFVDNVPTEYMNKWSRKQYKMVVNQDLQMRILSGGKKLFTKIREFCITNTKNPTDLGTIQIDRFGNGFETDYKLTILKKPK